MPLSRALRRHTFCAALAGSLFAYGAALAQSTGSQTAGEIVVTGQRQASTGGLAVQVKAAKDQSVVTREFIQHLVGTTNAAQAINLLPGVSYSTEDPTGILSSDFRMHGFDGAHVSFTIDGTPVNDTGNYAVYPGEYIVAEAIDHITVNMGQTEVDSPTASAIGGTVNIVSKKPSSTPETQVSVSGGSYDYVRAFGEYDTGAIGPTGLTSFLGVNYADSNKYKGRGDLQRWGLDGRVYQPLSGDGFISAAFTYVANRTYFYESDSLTQLQQFGKAIDYNTQWAVPTVTPGVADGIGGPGSGTAPGFEQGANSNFWKLHPNPVDFGDIRVQSRFDLGHDAILTVDPYFFYTLANGGGTTSLKETDPRLVGSGVATACGGTGVDLNGDGDCKDTVLFYSPSNTQTHRLGVNTSLIWDLNPHNRFQLAYTFDYGMHRQTGQFTPINQQTGEPDDVFGGKQGYGAQVVALDGAPLRTRDRHSIAMLNQVAVNYIGKFVDDRLHVNIGLRDPYFERDLDQFCYTYNGGSAYCDSVSPALVQAAYNTDVANHNAKALSSLLGISVAYNAAIGAPNFRFPFKQTYHFNKLLPNAGASFDLDDHSTLYLTYAQGFSAPKTDDLYTSAQQLVQPETSNQYGGGYRYQSPSITASVNLWGATWNNHIVQSYDPNDPTLSIDRNVGAVDLYGLDMEGGWRVNDQLNLYASATFMRSSLQNNYEVTVASGPDAGKSAPLPVKGKELVMTPDYAYAARAEYKLGDLLIGVDAKYTGRRFASDTNDAVLPAYTVADLDLTYRLNVLGTRSAVQLNVYNLFGKTYLDRVSTVSNAQAVNLPSGDAIKAASGPFYYVGAPTTVYVTLKTQF